MGATATGTYIVDAHLDMAVEAFLCITLFKNFVSFGMTLHVFDLLLNVGNTKVWIRSPTLSSSSFSFSSLSVPFRFLCHYLFI